MAAQKQKADTWTESSWGCYISCVGNKLRMQKAKCTCEARCCIGGPPDMEWDPPLRQAVINWTISNKISGNQELWNGGNTYIYNKTYDINGTEKNFYKKELAGMGKNAVNRDTDCNEAGIV